MPSLPTAALCLLLAVATAVGIGTAVNDDSQRPSVGSTQNDSGVVLYGGR